MSPLESRTVCEFISMALIVVNGSSSFRQRMKSEGQGSGAPLKQAHLETKRAGDKLATGKGMQPITCAQE